MGLVTQGGGLGGLTLGYLLKPRWGFSDAHFWPGVCSAWPWLKGGGVSRKAKRCTLPARGEADIGGGSECGRFCGGADAQARAS